MEVNLCNSKHRKGGTFFLCLLLILIKFIYCTSETVIKHTLIGF